MRCKNLAMRVLAAEILCDALPRCENTSDVMPRCRPLSSLAFFSKKERWRKKQGLEGRGRSFDSYFSRGSRFGSITVCARDGSNGSGFRLRWLLWEEGLSASPYSVSRGVRFRFWLRFLKNRSGGSGSAFAFWKTGPTAQVSGSSLVLEPPVFYVEAALITFP